MLTTSCLLSLVTLCLATGAMAFIAVVLVPMWRAMEPNAFLSTYVAFAPRTRPFLIPLGAMTLVAALVAAAVALWRGDAAASWTIAAAVLVAAWVAVYPLYFTGADALFTAAGADATAATAELARFQTWQWVRVALLAAAIACTVVATARAGAEPPAQASVAQRDNPA
jgi:hypothetical protein